ncbi:ABC-type multidrug transport system fused ATPase/permease subunit [Haloactinopolyspora alba]|uniref:ABC-type multidrug transport system fused ATPase/permease subunit n=1 Tax=Haloactinopolyspora alba TaxID=648780 RepID=A0A2P8E192_9ACTN|nr:ABC transporter ATP-binding protein [Haloactinopolyspora alba]PSL03242.1 ABC-type multidrug transport system fused ATPase/permease subunit [Haloactinopolyspora alba]
MRPLPLTDPGIPDIRSRPRFLAWIAARQWRTLAFGTVFGITWMLAQALMPWAIGHGIDGIVADDTESTWRWAALVGVLGVTQALSGMMRHRAAVRNWLHAAFRVIQLVGRQSARGGPAVPATMPTGEIVATASSDSMHIGHAMEVTPRFAGSVVSYVVVSVIVLQTSVALGLMVLIGVPLLVVALGPLVRPLQQRQHVQREALGDLTALGADTVGGLRVLRGIGGEKVFNRRYAERSEAVRASGVRVASTQAMLDAVLVLLPGIFLVLLTWVGARLVLDGTVEPGALVALYGYAFFLVLPVRTAGEMAFALTRAGVAARRVLRVLSVERDVRDDADAGTDTGAGSDDDGRPRPAVNGATVSGSPVTGTDAVATAAGELADPATGLRAAPGELTMLVADDASFTAAIADRLGRLVPEGGALLDGVPVDRLPLSEVRGRVVVSEPEPTLFTGTLRSGLDPHGRHDDARLVDAMTTASAGDVLETLRAGLDSLVEERGRSLSGGQRQRVALARVLVSDPEVLVLVEPTSAVDAHTEAAVAERLRAARAGRTTVVVTASPLLLSTADTVVWFDRGRVAATGTHDELLATTPAYRRTVTREEEPA